jgi:hypothetical protein
MGIFILSCSGKKRSDFVKQACSQANPNCAAPTVQIGTSGSESDQSGVTIGNGQNVNGAIKIKNIRYGDSTTLEFVLNNSTLNPLHDMTVEMIPGDVSFTVVPGITEASCTEGIFYYQQKCAVGIKFSPGATLPENQNIRFKFKTLTGGDFIFEAVIKPSDLLPDIYIAASELNFPSLMIYDSSQSCVFTQDLNVYNYGTINPVTDMHFSLQGDDSFHIQATAGYCSDGGTLAIQGGTCKLKICYKPTKKGNRIANLVLTGSNATVRQYTLFGKGVAFEGSSNFFDFGTLVAGTANSSSKTITYTVPTDAQSTNATSCSYSSTGSTQFSLVSNTCVSTPLSGSTCTVVIRYSAASVDQVDQGQFRSSCTQRGGAFTLSLSGISSSRPLVADKVQIDFGEMLIGETTTATIGLQNIGTGGALTGLSIPQIVSSGSGISTSRTTCGSSIAQGESCEVVLSFSPTQAGLVSSQFTATSNEVNLGRNIIVGGQGIAITASQTAVDFGVVLLDKDRPGPIITIANPAKISSATGCSIDATTLSAQGFSLETDSTCLNKTTLTAGESCTLKPRFNSKSPEGERAATIKMNCSVGGTVNIALSASARNELRLVAIPPLTANFSNRLVGITQDVEFTFENQHESLPANNISISTTTPTSWARVVATNASSDCNAVTSLAVGANCGVRLRYSPSATAGAEAIGATTGTISASADSASIDAADPIYTATAVKITASTSVYDFSVVSTATTDAISSETFIITNPSSMDTASGCVLSMSNSTDFAFYNETCGSTLEPSTLCNFRVKAKSSGRTTSTNASGYAYYTCSVGGQASVNLAAQIKKPPVIAWTPTTLSYGTVDITLTQGGTLTLSHTGTLLDSAARNLVVSVTGSKFSINSNNCPSQLNAGLSCLVGVDFHSTTEGTFTANLIATSTIDNLSVTASLVGVASAARLVSGTSSVNLGVVSLNSTGVSNAITLTNTSTIIDDTNCNITTSTYYSLFSNTCGTGFTLAKGASCNFKVQLNAQATVGTYTGTTSIDCADPGPVVTIPLTARVLDTANLSIGTTPSTDFGYQDIDKNAKSQTYTITNLESMSVTFSTLAFDSNSSSSSFTRNGGTCTPTTTLAANGTCTVTIDFDPTVDTTTTGETATLVVGTEGYKPGSHKDFVFTGKGSTMSLALTSSTFGFASREVSQASYQTLSSNLSNNGTRPALLGYSALASPPFTSVGVCSGTLSAGATCTISIQFAAAAAGAIHNSTYTITESQSAKTAAISLIARTYDQPVINIKDNLDNTTFATTIGTTYITGATIGHSRNIIDGSPSNRSVIYTILNAGSTNAAPVSVGSLAAYFASVGTLSGTMNIVSGTSDSCSNSTLVASTGSCNFTVRYTPSTYHESSTYAMANIPYVSTVSAATYATSISAIIGESTRSASLSLTVATLEYGPITAGSSLIKSFIVTNTGDQTATSLLYVVSGSAGAGVFATPVPTYVPTPDYCSTSLLGNNSTCTVDVKFSPSLPGAFLDRFNISGAQAGVSRSVVLRGASYSEAMLAGTAAEEGWEADIAGDGSRYYIISRKLNVNVYEPILNICNRNSTTGYLDESTCSISDLATILGISPTSNFAGKSAGSGPRILVSGSKIIILLENKDLNHGGDNGAGSAISNSTVIICSVPGTNSLSNGDCHQNNIHVDLGLRGYGIFGSMAINSNKFILSSQSAAGNAIALVACNFDGTQALGSVISSCTSQLIAGSSAQGNHTNLFFNGSRLVVASYYTNTSLLAITGTLDTSTNVITAGALTTIDTDRTADASGYTNEASGSWPTVYFDNNKLFISYQFGSTAYIQYKLATCDVSGNTITPCTSQTFGVQGSGASPRMVATGNSTSGNLWISGCLLPTAASINSSACRMQLYKCPMVSGVATCESTPYFQQPTSLGTGVIYSRSLFLDTIKKILIAPFAYMSGGSRVNGAVNLGLLPEL